MIQVHILKLENIEFNHTISYPVLEIEKGSIVFIEGPSGCGKSSLLRILNHTREKTKGTMYYKGQNCDDLDTLTSRKKMILVAQENYLYNTTIQQNFTYYHQLRNQEVPDEQSIKEYLRITNLNKDLQVKSDLLSGGEKQRLFIAIALSMQPEVLLLDEPTSALDSENAKQMMQNLVSYAKQQGITMLVVSHDTSLVKEYAEKRYQLGERK